MTDLEQQQFKTLKAELAASALRYVASISNFESSQHYLSRLCSTAVEFGILCEKHNLYLPIVPTPNHVAIP